MRTKKTTKKEMPQKAIQEDDDEEADFMNDLDEFEE